MVSTSTESYILGSNSIWCAILCSIVMDICIGGCDSKYLLNDQHNAQRSLLHLSKPESGGSLVATRLCWVFRHAMISYMIKSWQFIWSLWPQRSKLDGFKGPSIHLLSLLRVEGSSLNPSTSSKAALGFFAFGYSRHHTVTRHSFQSETWFTLDSEANSLFIQHLKQNRLAPLAMNQPYS